MNTNVSSQKCHELPRVLRASSALKALLAVCGHRPRVFALQESVGYWSLDGALRTRELTKPVH
jgi:hypothetical protein